MKRALTLLLPLLCLSVLCSCGEKKEKADNVKMHYDVSFEDPSTHYVDVKLTLSGLNKKSVELHLPVWAPGYYEILDSPKHLVDFNATTNDGKPLTWEKPTKNSWVIKSGKASDIIITYRVFANKKSVAEANVNREKAFLAMNEIFMYIEGRKDLPVTVTFYPWEGWSKISTGLRKLEARSDFDEDNAEGSAGSGSADSGSCVTSGTASAGSGSGTASTGSGSANSGSRAKFTSSGKRIWKGVPVAIRGNGVTSSVAKGYIADILDDAALYPLTNDSNLGSGSASAGSGSKSRKGSDSGAREDSGSAGSTSAGSGSSTASAGSGSEATVENTYYAENADVLFDSPVFIGNQMTLDFNHEGKDFSICVARPRGLDTARFASDFRKIVTAATEIMQDIPYDNYTVIMMEPGGGGLEHKNSQAIFSESTWRFPSKKSYLEFMNFVAHEYFHLYNVKCIRPIELGPFNYDAENYTESLWISEGLTCFYEYVIMKNAGLSSARNTLDFLTGNILSYEPYEGKNHQSLAESSRDIWLNFFNDDENSKDVRISYYTKGPVIGFLLDIAIRNATNNEMSCDDVMRALYNRYYKKADRGFTPDEFWELCKEIAGDDLKDIEDYVYTTCPVDYAKYLSYAGLTIDEKYNIDLMEECDEMQLEIRRSVIGE